MLRGKRTNPSQLWYAQHADRVGETVSQASVERRQQKDEEISKNRSYYCNTYIGLAIRCHINQASSHIVIRKYNPLD